MADYTDRLIELEARIQELESRIGGLTDVLGTLQPIRGLLVKYGVADAQQTAVHLLISAMSSRLDKGEAGSFTEFQEQVTGVVPERRDDRRFFELLIEAIRIERPDSRRLTEHFTTGMALLRP